MSEPTQPTPKPPLPGEANTSPEMTIESFTAQWGNCGFEKEQLAELWSFAESCYRNLPYHNFEHALETLWSAMDQVDEAEKNGIAVNRKVIIGAALLHDANFHEALVDSKHASKEAYSAAIFAEHAAEFGYTNEEMKLGQKAINDTQVDQTPETPESKILVRADLDNIGGDYETRFLYKTGLLHEESAELLGNKMSFEDFTKISVEILTKYLSNDLSLGESDTKFAAWKQQALDNLRRLALSVEGRAIPDGLAVLLGNTALGGESATT